MKTIEDHIAQYRSLNLHEVVNYDKFNEFAITAHSTQIEGSTLTEQEAALLLDEGITPKGKPLEHSLMVKDHHQALQLAISNGKQGKPFSVDGICQLNATVMKNTGQIYNTALGTVDASKGELRKGAVFVQSRYFPAHNKVPGLIKSLCEELNYRMAIDLSLRQQIDLSYSAHFNLVSIHPHYDGNGRTSRLLMTQLQARYNLPYSIVYKEDKQDYFTSLEESRAAGNMNAFREFMDSQYTRYLKEQIDLHQKQVKKNNQGLRFFF